MRFDDQSDSESTISENKSIQLDLEFLNEPTTKKKRIRERLDHLSHEEKLQRRKIKNRISAQSARDRKKNRMQILEKKIEILLHDRKKFLEENFILKKQNEKIVEENDFLKQKIELLEKNSQINSSSTPQELVLEHNLSELEHFINEDSNVNSKFTSFGSAELINVPQQKVQDVKMEKTLKSMNLKMNKKPQMMNKNLTILIKHLISLLIMMMMNVKKSSNGSKAVTKVYLIQTLKKLRQILPKEQMKILLLKIMLKQMSLDHLNSNQILKSKKLFWQEAII